MRMVHAALQSSPMLRLCVFTCFLAVRADVGQECPKFTSLGFPDAILGTNLKVQLLLYTKRNPNCAETFGDHNNHNLTVSTYLNVTKKTIIIIHGYRPTGSPPVWIDKIKDLLLEIEDANILIVDWNRGATTLNYPSAVSNAKKLVDILKNLLEQMLENGATLESFYMIGVSLGAHVAGLLGKAYGGKIGRITGLDPAGPLFTGKSSHERLDYTDAQFVDVIHTDIDALGYRKPLGNIDFYPNGGTDQPGCPASLLGGVSQYFKCDHQRSVYLYMASLEENCNVTAYPCDSYEDYRNGKCVSCKAFHPLPCPVPGYYADKWKNHLIEKSPPVTTAYFDTSDKEPFCIYHYFVNIVIWNKNSRSGFIKIKITDNAGNTTESKIYSDAAAFHQYKHAKILAGFSPDFDNIAKISLTFSTRNVVGPKYKLRVLEMRLKSLSVSQRIQLCRYDFTLLENIETSFRPIPCLDIMD
nr:lipase member I isoform X1 [Anolis sagrei ordinatus]XP_060626498.1 lipase member I isoform X1 [Anolis sagrei ordinatus]XP_060626499.1 lipase member I isoform X1 [Anolis sagrei ordinatus]